MGMFIATFVGVVGVVRATYPDKPSVDRGFEDGLFEELGGEGAVHVSFRMIAEQTGIGANNFDRQGRKTA